jgi:hypothetical protein
MSDEELISFLEKIERKKFFKQMQSQVEKEGHLHPNPMLFQFLRKMAVPFKYIGSILWGIILSIITIFVTYIVIVYWAIRLITTLTICSIFLLQKIPIYGVMAVKRITLLFILCIYSCKSYFNIGDISF